MGIDLKDPTPLYLQIAEDIKSKIFAGELKVGEQLASQNELAEEYSVSLITVKKALAELNRDGFLYSRVGKGTFVAKRSGKVDFSKLKTIGFVLRDMESPFFSRILSGVERQLSENDYNLLLSSTSGKADKEESQIQHFLEIGVTGLIIASMSRTYFASPVIRQLQQHKFPYVVVSYIADEDISYVGTDHEYGAFMMTEHLINVGYKKIGYINGEEGSLLGELRKSGFLKALKKHDLSFNPEFEYRLRLRGEWYDFESGYEIGTSFLEAEEKPEALFIYNDLSALGFERALLDHGLRIPQDIAIAGFDNIKRGLTAPVPLTTINQPTDQIAKLAVDMILKKIENAPYKARQILTPNIVIRDSCGTKLRNPALLKQEKDYNTAF